MSAAEADALRPVDASKCTWRSPSLNPPIVRFRRQESCNSAGIIRLWL